jgi:2-haloacid dehalogenase
VKKVLIFDAYGTLFNVLSPVAILKDKAIDKNDLQNVSILWRQKQLEYTWTLTLMQRYMDFYEVTKLALDYTLKNYNLYNIDIKNKLMDAYEYLGCHDDVLESLQYFKESDYTSVILSNATHEMLKKTLNYNKIGEYIDHIISVDDIKIYKPHPEVYHYAVKKLNREKEDILFVSSNPWDIAGATSFGLEAIWLNRQHNVFGEYPFKPKRVINHLKELIQ